MHEPPPRSLLFDLALTNSTRPSGSQTVSARPHPVISEGVAIGRLIARLLTSFHNYSGAFAAFRWPQRCYIISGLEILCLHPRALF